MTRMTLPRFLRAFKRIAHKGQWMLSGEHLRHRRSYRCPLVRVAGELTGEWYANSRYPEAAAAIGMRCDAAHRVAAAADEGESESWRTRYLRRRLMAAAGVEG